MEESEYQSKIDDAIAMFLNLEMLLKNLKPDNRSEIDRKFAICITDLEKVDAYFSFYIAQENQ